MPKSEGRKAAHVWLRKWTERERGRKDVFVLQWQLSAIRAYRWMPRHKEPMKDVAACEKSRGGGKQPLIRECPNGETWSDVESDRDPAQAGERVPAEVKHLSKQRKRKKRQSLVLGPAVHRRHAMRPVRDYRLQFPE